MRARFLETQYVSHLCNVVTKHRITVEFNVTNNVKTSTKPTVCSTMYWLHGYTLNNALDYRSISHCWVNGLIVKAE